MTGLWDNIKKSVGELATKAAEKGREITREAADKAEELTKLGKIKLDIFQIKRDIEKKLTDLGGVAYELLNAPESTDIPSNAKVQSLVQEIKNLEQQLKVKEAQYEQVKAAAKEESKPTEPSQATNTGLDSESGQAKDGNNPSETPQEPELKES